MSKQLLSKLNSAISNGNREEIVKIENEILKNERNRFNEVNYPVNYYSITEFEYEFIKRELEQFDTFLDY